MKAEEVWRIIDALPDAAQRSVAAYAYSVACGVSNRGARHIVDRTIALVELGEDESDVMRRLNPSNDSMRLQELETGVNEWAW